MALGTSIGIGILVVVAIVALWFIAAYNGFVRLRNQVQNSWAQIDVQLKRRTDLIPNLIIYRWLRCRRYATAYTNRDQATSR